MHLKRQTPCPSLPTSPGSLRSVQISSYSGSSVSDTKYGSRGCGGGEGEVRDRGQAGCLLQLPPTRAAGTLARDAGPQGVACTSCPNSGTRRELSIDTSCNRGCPHKQNNPVLGQQLAAGGRVPSRLLGLQGRSVAVNTPGCLGHSSPKTGCKADAKTGRWGPLNMEPTGIHVGIDHRLSKALAPHAALRGGQSYHTI